MTHQTPNRIDLYRARTCANDVAERLTAVIHLELLDHGLAKSMAQSYRQLAWEQLEELAQYFGAELVEIEPEQEPEPLDVETVAARGESYRQQVKDAGRGHQVEG